MYDKELDVERMTSKNRQLRQKAIKNSCNGHQQPVIVSKKRGKQSDVKQKIKKFVSIAMTTAIIGATGYVISKPLRDDYNYYQTIEYAKEDLLSSGLLENQNGEINFSNQYSPNEILSEIKNRYNLDQEKNAYGNDTHEALLLVKEAAGDDDMKRITGQDPNEFYIENGYTTQSSDGSTYPDSKVFENMNQSGLVKGIETYKQSNGRGK